MLATAALDISNGLRLAAGRTKPTPLEAGDDTTLDCRWRLDDAPPGATLEVGAPLAGVVGPTPTWQPPATGRWAIGLVVVDAGGLASTPVVVIVNVQL